MKSFLRYSALISAFFSAVFLLGQFFTSRNNLPVKSTLAQTTSYDWPQVQNNPQRTGYSPEVLGTNFSVAWTHPFQPEKVYPQVQAIVYQGKVFVGTEGANGQAPSLYALNATTGQQLWKFTAGGPILASVAAANGNIYFGAMDGAVYALNTNTGSQIWKKQVMARHGFSTAPVIADNKILLGGRDGKFYALDPANGNILWQYDTGSYILQTAAYNNGRVFFGAMNMRVYALNSSNGTLAWQSQPLKAAKNNNNQAIVGKAFKDYWPVVHQGKVIVRADGLGSLTDAAAVANYLADPDCVSNLPNNLGCPYPRTMFVFDEVTGVDTPIIHSMYPLMHGGMTPPCVDRDNNLIVPIGGWSTQTWGRQNLTTGAIVDRFTTIHNNGDENENVSCSFNLIFILHTIDRRNWGIAGLSGYYNLDTRTWVNVGGGAVNAQMYTNTLGGGGNPASIANGMVYHITIHELVARKAQ